MNTLEQILDLARWAPSGDNVQSHRFEVLGEDALVIHARDTRADTVYDLDGHASQVSFGALLETMRIAASQFGWRMDAQCRQRVPGRDDKLLFDVNFAPDASVQPDPLCASIRTRTVQRRPMRTRPLSPQEKQALESCLGPDYTVRWYERFGQRWQVARLMYRNAGLRLALPEAFEVHRRIIDWHAVHSPDRVPAQSLGLDRLTLRLMKWAMAAWSRMAGVNRIVGTWMPRLQMDLLPGLMCAGHFVLQARLEPRSVDDYVAAGRAMQRFWLTLTSLGLLMQPEMTPLIFARYAREGRRFTAVERLQQRAAGLSEEFGALTDGQDRLAMFAGRLGAGPAPQSRAVRQPLAELMYR